MAYQARQDSLIRQLQGKLGAARLSELRVTALTSCAGAGATTAVPVVTSGVGTVWGVIVLTAAPVAHWSFGWFPRTTDIMVRNDGATQDIAFRYLVIGA